MSTKDTFTKIYETNHWDGEQSISGTGSDDSQTQTIVNAIGSLIEELNIKSILDLPCGDFRWMKSVNMEDVNYIGADIVDEIIENNSKMYANDKIRFSVINLLSDPLPQSDLLLVRDCLVHLSFKDIYTAMQNIKSLRMQVLY